MSVTSFFFKGTDVFIKNFKHSNKNSEYFRTYLGNWNNVPSYNVCILSLNNKVIIENNKKVDRKNCVWYIKNDILYITKYINFKICSTYNFRDTIYTEYQVSTNGMFVKVS